MDATDLASSCPDSDPMTQEETGLPSTYCFSSTVFLGATATKGNMHNEDVSWLPVWTVQSVPSTPVFFPPHMKAKRFHTAWLKQILSQRRLDPSFVNNTVGCKAAGIVKGPSAHIREIMRNSFWMQACSLSLIFIEASVFQLHEKKKKLPKPMGDAKKGRLMKS